jgi:hypothetical protein
MTRWQRGSGRGTDASGKVQSARVMASTNPWRELKRSLSNTVPGWVRFYGRSPPSMSFAFRGGSRAVLVAVAFAHWGAQRESSSC